MFDCAKGFCIIFEYRRLLWMILWLFVCDFFGIGCVHTAYRAEHSTLWTLIFIFIRSNSILVFTTSFPYLFCLVYFGIVRCETMKYNIFTTIYFIFGFNDTTTADCVTVTVCRADWDARKCESNILLRSTYFPFISVTIVIIQYKSLHFNHFISV